MLSPGPVPIPSNAFGFLLRDHDADPGP
jgi:hypothetical protein